MFIALRVYQFPTIELLKLTRSVCVYRPIQTYEKFRTMKKNYYKILAHNRRNPDRRRSMGFMEELGTLLDQLSTSNQSDQSGTSMTSQSRPVDEDSPVLQPVESDMTKTSQPVTQSQDRHAASSPRTEESNGGPATPAADTGPPTDRPAESEPQPGHTPGAARSDPTQGQRIAR